MKQIRMLAQYYVDLMMKLGLVRFSMLLAAGLTTLLALQVFLNVAVVTNLLPSTGISLPFFSYGGTALIMQLAENGIVLNVSRSITQSPR